MKFNIFEYHYYLGLTIFLIYL